jgi:hypothetical protein
VELELVKTISSGSEIDEIDSFHAIFHVAAKDVSIVGISAE